MNARKEETDEDRLFRALTRTPFDEFVKAVAEYTGDKEDYLVWIWSKASDPVGGVIPHLLHGNFYKSHGWEWKDMIHEAKRRS